METSTEVELNQLLEELSEIKADEDDEWADDDSPPPPPPRDSLVFDSPLDEAARSSQRVSIKDGKISYYEEPTARSSDRFNDTGNERFSTRPGANVNSNNNKSSVRSSDRFNDTGNERFSTRPGANVNDNNNNGSGVRSSDRFNDTGNERFSVRGEVQDEGGDDRFDDRGEEVQEEGGDDRFDDRGEEVEQQDEGGDDRFDEEGDDRFDDRGEEGGFTESEPAQVPTSTKCGVCGKEIEGDALQALGQLFHFECFSCSECKKKIGTEEFFEKNDKAYCVTCYKKSFLPNCSRCRKVIEGRYLKALNQDFHEECFTCAVCNKPFDDGKFYEKDENPYCLQHYNELYGYTCAKCHQTITDGTAIAALDKYWHRDCFSCTKCNQPFTDGKFFEDEGEPYCQEHYHERKGTICGKCSQPIDGMCVSALGKKWHQNCFTCTKCSGVLSGQVMLSDDKVYCPDCASTL